MKKDTVIQIITFVLVCLGITYVFLLSGETKYTKAKNHAETQIASIYETFNDISQFENAKLEKINQKEFEQLNRKLPFHLFIYEDGKLVFWNANQAVVPDLNIQDLTTEAQLITLKNGYYIAMKKTIGNKDYVAISLLRNSYSLVNKYLNNQFSSAYLFQENDIILPALHSSGDAIKSPSGKIIFKIQQQNPEVTEVDTWRMIFCLLIAIFTYFFVLFFTKFIQERYNVNYGLLTLITFGFVWILIIQWLPFEFKKTNIFNPELYGSIYFSSLGNLMIYTLYFFSVQFYIFINTLRKKLLYTNLFKFIIGLFLIGFFVYINLVLRSLVLDSIINYGPKNLTLLNIYALLGISIAFFLSLALVFNAYTFIYVIRKIKHFIVLIVIFFFILTSIFYYFEFGILAISLSLLFSLFIYFLYYYIVVLKKNSTAFIIAFALFFMVLLVSSIARVYTLEKVESTKKTLAFKKSRQRDVTAEDLFTKIEQRISEDAFVINFFENPIISYNDIYKRLNSLYFGGYFSKYDVTITPYNTEGNAIKVNSETSLQDNKDLIIKLGEPTLNKSLHFIADKEEMYSYLALLTINDSIKKVGVLAIKISPKSYDIGNVYPELLLEGKKNLINQYQDDYEFAIFYNDKLISQSEDYAYQSNIENLKEKSYTKNGFKHSIFDIDSNKKIIISTKNETFFDIFSVFSFVLCFYFILGFTLATFYFGITQNVNFDIFHFSFRKKIHIAMFTLVISSFLVIGFSTIQFFAEQFKETQQKRLITKQKSISTALEYVITKNTLLDEAKFLNYFNNSLNVDLAEISDIHKMDINLYDTNGKLISSSQDGIFTSGLLSNLMNPKALVKLNEAGNNLVLQDEFIGNLNYSSVYVPLLNANGKEMAYLNIPYFAKEKNLKKDISNFMISLVNVYVLLLLIASLVAFVVSNSITNPLKTISEKLKDITLTKTNARLEWNASDEIGILVAEYNKMIEQLEQNAKLLAQSERDSAWREMAKQIAHEIKNPLTPMKLSIQHLQRALKDDPERGAALAAKVSNTLIEQINNLSDIATAFSSFAKMPKGNKEQIDLVEVLEASVSLFEIETTALKRNYLIDKAIVYADKNQLISVFNNLIKNATQATEENENMLIEVSLNADKNYYYVSVFDNGIGIANDKLAKVFVPNFTTKSSGTGLGLAISKQIIEELEGDIWFETIENEWTKFIVKIPKYNS